MNSLTWTSYAPVPMPARTGAQGKMPLGDCTEGKKETDKETRGQCQSTQQAGGVVKQRARWQKMSEEYAIGADKKITGRVRLRR